MKTNMKMDSLEGIHKVDGVFFKVQIAHHGSGHPYAKRLDVYALPSGVQKGKWVYAPGAVRMLSESTFANIDDAASFGRLYGICCVCGRILTRESSIEAGIGPVCSGKVGPGSSSHGD